MKLAAFDQLHAFNPDGVQEGLGQLASVAAVLTATALARHIKLLAPINRYALTSSAYGIGCLAAFWFCERIVQIL
ncbi:hypothetical protein [Microbulbifer taiwanensis]|uniref:Uncharacterized protein n=1 Tax=Microbulbifer taiwanensis TaxID=986746 RepID=A0ABW1YQR6_9GAMM|nr:hypothetical protein [Microbulbifer taiwanensis]